MKILFIIPSLRLAGAEQVTVELINALAAKGYCIHLLTFESDLSLKSAVDSSKVSFYHFSRRYKYDLSIAARVAEIIDREKIDVVYCVLQIAMLFGYLGLRLARYKPKLIDAIHTTINRTRKDDYLDKILYVPLMRRCDRVIAVCDTQKSHWVKKFPSLAERITTIHNGVDAQTFSRQVDAVAKTSLRKKLGIQDGELVIGMVAGFRPEKNHKDVLAAVSCLVKNGMPVKLLLVGDGGLRQELENIIGGSGLTNRVIMVGFTKEPRQYLSIFDVGVLFSSAETFSMAILEMFAMCIPVVASDIGGTSEMVQNDVNGYLVKSHDVMDLTEKLTVLLSQPEKQKQLGTNARQTVLDRFTKGVMLDKTMKMLDDVVS